MADKIKKNLCLKDGSMIVIIGGGPSGSFFAYLAFRHAKKLGINISVTIFEVRDFSQRGPKGCNMSAAVIAKSLYQKLIKEGIDLPDNVVRQEIKGYYFQTKEYGIELHRPKPGLKNTTKNTTRNALSDISCISLDQVEISI